MKTASVSCVSSLCYVDCSHLVSFLPSSALLNSDSLALKQKVGQLMVIGFDGTTMDSDLRQMINEYHIGGVVLFARNIQSPGQVAALTNELQQTAIESGNPG